MGSVNELGCCGRQVRQGQQAKLDQCESLQGTPGHRIYLYSLEAGFGETRLGGRQKPGVWESAWGVDPELVGSWDKQFL